MKTGLVLLSLAAFAAPCGDAPKPIEIIRAVITADAMRAAVAELSSDEMGGRFYRSPFAEKAAKWIEARFDALALAKGATKESYRQAIDKNVESGPNLIATLAGSGTGYIIVSAHYDHLRPKRTGEDRIYNGADDNASGVCGMLAVAQALKELIAKGEAPSCTILFVAFNGEEAGLLGSRAFVKSPTVPLGEIRGVFNMDMISRGPPREIFIDGGPIGAPVVEALKVANETIGMKLRLNEHPDWLDRSDQGPFLAKKVPAVLFSVEDHADYHKVSDEVAKIDPALAAETAQLVALAALNLSKAPFTARVEVVPAVPAVPAVDH
ncbi:MAG: M20/M25/M40 family metallo-hydrolase [Phycisphaerales bacterium]|nr:M20/M25/M40 family metallo-hydrolase [Phycisphaerales bacterium]